jgi:hypothetical protein
MEKIDKTYEELITIPVYDEERYPDMGYFKDSHDIHYFTKEKSFRYEDILAITTKDSPIDQKYHCSRGGALIFVRGREVPYLTEDHYSVKKIYRELNQNPLACLSGLNQVGSSKIYANEGELVGNIYVLPNGVRLYLTDDAVRKLKFIKYVCTKGSKKSCFYETKSHHRMKYKK